MYEFYSTLTVNTPDLHYHPSRLPHVLCGVLTLIVATRYMSCSRSRLGSLEAQQACRVVWSRTHLCHRRRAQDRYAIGVEGYVCSLGRPELIAAGFVWKRTWLSRLIAQEIERSEVGHTHKQREHSLRTGRRTSLYKVQTEGSVGSSSQNEAKGNTPLIRIQSIHVIS